MTDLPSIDVVIPVSRMWYLPYLENCLRSLRAQEYPRELVGITISFVAEDPDRAWAELGPHMLHDAQMYAAWMGDDIEASSKSVASNIEELRAESGPYRIFTPEEAVKYVQDRGMLMTQPLSGGIPPELAWPSLELIVDKVLPALEPN